MFIEVFNQGSVLGGEAVFVKPVKVTEEELHQLPHPCGGALASDNQSLGFMSD